METLVYYLLLVIGAIFTTVLCLRQWYKAKRWHADGAVMRGKTVLITGASSGEFRNYRKRAWAAHNEC